jgi:hypothetical protein
MACRGEILMDLPRALWPWRQPLSIFPHELAIALGGMVDKLALLVGPMVSPEKAGRGEPDGLNGIGRRGSFERLLATEWALAEEAPLEFLRRVSTGELSFLEIAHQKPTIARQCVVLFDVGPDAFGAPKIVHLAALILLAQRAYDGGARFSWGVLQDPSAELLADVNEESVRKLVKAGSNRPMVIDDAIRFCESLQEDRAEVWFIGGQGTSRLISEVFSHNIAWPIWDISPHRIEIEDSFDPDAPFDLHVTVCSERQKARSVRLELPPTATSVRLLRDPFQLARVTPKKIHTRIGNTTNIVFARDYRKLFIRGAEGELLTIPIPNSPNVKETPRLRVFRPPAGETLVGVGRLMHTRTIAAVTKNEDSVFVHELSTRASTSVKSTRYSWDQTSNLLGQPELLPDSADSETTGQLASLIQLDSNSELFLYNPPRDIFRLDAGTIQLWCYIDSVYQNGSLLYHVQTGESPVLRVYAPGRMQTVKLDHPAQTSILAPGGYVATKFAARTWDIWNETGKLLSTHGFADECEVVGFMGSKDFTFFVLDASRTHIECIASDKIEPCLTAPAPIRTINAAAGCWLIAFITVENELCVYSRDHKTFVLRMRLGAA